MVEGFHGVPFRSPLQRTREYIESCRTIWRREPYAFDGHTVQAPLRPPESSGLGVPLKLFGALLFQVAGQQLSVAATRRTIARIQALFGGHLPAPAELLGVVPGQLREAGLSWRKVSTLRDLAERLSEGRLDPDVLSSLPDDELMAELTAIPGIGPWTVQGAPHRRAAA